MPIGNVAGQSWQIQSLDPGQQSKRKVGLLLGQFKQLAKLTQTGAGRQQFDHVPKTHAQLGHPDG